MIHHFEEVGSTNDVADRLAREGAPDGTAVTAELQTAGRGRLGRTWFSPPGAGLYVSIVVRPGHSLVTLAAGVAFAEGVRATTHLPVEIKWPNDLVIGKRKLAGILTEAVGAGSIEYMVVGFGLNLRSAAYPPDIADRATSIEAELGRAIDREPVLAGCLASFGEVMRGLRAGKQDEILDRWRRLAPACVDANVEWTSPLGPRTGTTAGLDTDGALLVKTANGTERIFAGEVRWL